MATVVPSLTAPIRSAGTGSPGARPSSSRTPATAASRYAGLTDSSLCATSEPSGRLATMSVNVPPRSTQKSHKPPISQA